MARAVFPLAHCAPFVGMVDTAVLFATPHRASTGVVGVGGASDAAPKSEAVALISTLASLETPNTSSAVFSGVPDTVKVKSPTAPARVV